MYATEFSDSRAKATVRNLRRLQADLEYKAAEVRKMADSIEEDLRSLDHKSGDFATRQDLAHEVDALVAQALDTGSMSRSGLHAVRNIYEATHTGTVEG